MPSLAAKVLNSGHTSSRDALRSLAALITAALFSTSSRIAGKVEQTRWASEGRDHRAAGPPNPPPAGPQKPPPGVAGKAAGRTGRRDGARLRWPGAAEMRGSAVSWRWRKRARLLAWGRRKRRPTAGRPERSGPAAAETAPQPGTARQQPERMRRPKPGNGASDMASSSSSPSPTPLGTAIHTKPTIRAIGRHQGAPPRRIRMSDTWFQNLWRRRAGRRKAGQIRLEDRRLAQIRLSKSAALRHGRAEARGGGRARKTAGALSPQRAASQARRRGPGVQRQGWRMAGSARRRQAPGPHRAGADPAADRTAGPALPVCAAQARTSRLHGAEGGRDGRVAAAAGADATHPGQARQSRAHARQCDRGGRAMRRAVNSRNRRADDVCPRARRPQARSPAGVLRRGGGREGPGGRARRRARRRRARCCR